MTDELKPIPLTQALRTPRMEFDAHAMSTDFGRMVELSIVGWHNDHCWIAEPAVMIDIGESDNFYGGPPTMSMTKELAQSVIDALWSAGLRPTQGHGSAGQIGATERHLADMRAIVSKKLDVTLKP